MMKVAHAEVPLGTKSMGLSHANAQDKDDRRLRIKTNIKGLLLHWIVVCIFRVRLLYASVLCKQPRFHHAHL